MRTHGLGKPLSYSSWRHMKSRCLAPNNNRYVSYNLRGIKVCEQWLSFENFHKDMGDRPSRLHSLDRIDNDGDYTPDNCKWSTNKEQANNRRTSHLITIKGEAKTLAQWCDAVDINYSTISSRINLYNWPIEKALGLTL